MIKRIRSFFSILFLSAVLVKSFRKELRTVLFREGKEADYLSQNQFDKCADRAHAIIMEATRHCENMLTVAIANHREKFHGENHVKEKKKIAKFLTPKEINNISRVWWQG